jgi:hypothetical protein
MEELFSLSRLPPGGWYDRNGWGTNPFRALHFTHFLYPASGLKGVAFHHLLASLNCSSCITGRTINLAIYKLPFTSRVNPVSVAWKRRRFNQNSLATAPIRARAAQDRST